MSTVYALFVSFLVCVTMYILSIEQYERAYIFGLVTIAISIKYAAERIAEAIEGKQ